MINLLTDLKQAISRQRDKSNPNYNCFLYIFNQNNFEKTEKELIRITDNCIRQITDNCTLLNELKQNNDAKFESTLKTFSESQSFKTYTYYENGSYIVDL